MPEICEVGGGGMWLPLFGDWEQGLPNALRCPFYVLGLGWCFMGVAIVSDVFMGAIEVITSKKTRLWDAEHNRHKTVAVWNPTVANLTLMALGSSAPEIMLSVIEILSDKFFCGKLGPSTIVGSAAFNLFVIIAVCVLAIPDGQVRRIKEMPVYCVTATFSIFAYVWLLIILLLISPNVVEVWEGVLTFLFFPILVALAWSADKGYFSCFSGRARTQKERLMITEGITMEELAEIEVQVRKEYGQGLTEEQVGRIIQIKREEPPSRAKRRVAATRNLFGGKQVRLSRVSAGVDILKKTMSGAFKTTWGNTSQVVPSEPSPDEEEPLGDSVTQLEFSCLKHAVLENAGSVTVIVVRTGNADGTAKVKYKTVDGTAKASQKDYVHVEDELVFGPGVKEMPITVTIVDDAAYEDDEEFTIELFDPVLVDPSGCDCEVALGFAKVTTIVIIDDDHPGELSFTEDGVTATDDLHVQDTGEDAEITIKVARQNGSTGKITCKFRTEDDTAKAHYDYEPAEGTLEFEHQQMFQTVDLKLLARGRYERCEKFRLLLEDATGGGTFNKDTDGAEECAILTIWVETGQVQKQRVERLFNRVSTSWEKSKVGHSNWRSQFVEALFVNGGDDEESDEEASPSLMDWATHIITVPWKLFFALVPPTDYCGGWVCFVCSLLMIGVVTAYIGDMANLVGCTMGVPAEVTAITFVALGTSLPDTFASKTAATQDPYADASVGNVTGSNSVNVFLGLGLPWMLASLYWTVNDPNSKWVGLYALDPDIDLKWRESGAFIVKADNLGFSVMIFSSCAFACITVLYVRRMAFGGELGGPKIWQYVTACSLVGLWVTFVVLFSWKAISEKNKN